METIQNNSKSKSDMKSKFYRFDDTLWLSTDDIEHVFNLVNTGNEQRNNPDRLISHFGATLVESFMQNNHRKDKIYEYLIKKFPKNCNKIGFCHFSDLHFQTFFF
jgi:type I restriction-modification system DNA methylase subunit